MQLFFFEKSLFTTRNENFTGSQIDRLCATPESFFLFFGVFFLIGLLKRIIMRTNKTDKNMSRELTQTPYC